MSLILCYNPDMGKEARLERRRQEAKARERDTGEPKLPVYDLFPISEIVASKFKNTFSVSDGERFKAALISERDGFKTHDEPTYTGMQIQSKLISNSLDVRYADVFMGMVMGHWVLREEADERKGVLPILSGGEIKAAAAAALGIEGNTEALSDTSRLAETPVGDVLSLEQIAVNVGELSQGDKERIKEVFSSGQIKELDRRIEAFPDEEEYISAALDSVIDRDPDALEQKRHPILVGFLSVYHTYKIMGDIRQFEAMRQGLPNL